MRQSKTDNPEHLKLALNSKIGEGNGDCHTNFKVKVVWIFDEISQGLGN